MFDSREFLDRVLAKGSKAAIGRALDLPSSRVAEFFREKGKGQRRLSMEEGIKLAQAFDIALDERVSVERLDAVLRVVLRYPPKDGWSEKDAGRLAQEIAYGLELLRSVGTSPPSSEALDVAARAIAQHFPDKLD